MGKTAIPSVFPAEGTYELSTLHVNLSCAASHAVIHYTIDGTEPTADSPIYHREAGLIPVKHTDGAESITIRAFAQADGLQPSDTVAFTYRFACRPKGVFRHSLLREPSDTAAGLIRIEDFDLDRMYLIIGQKRAALIDAGWDYDGDLPALCHALTGGLPVDLLIAHGHPDHVAQAGKFIEYGCKVYAPYADKSMKQLDCGLDFTHIEDLKDGMRFDLGGTVLQIYATPGHTPGSVVILDENTGDLFASDSFGSNRREIPDSAWLQLSGYSLESCLRSLEAFLDAAGNKCKRIFTGHNAEMMDAQQYLSTLRKAMHNAVDNGAACLFPSLRSAAESFGSGSIAVEGDWRHDPIWAAANLQFLYDIDTQQDPPRYAPGFDPTIKTIL